MANKTTFTYVDFALTIISWTDGETPTPETLALVRDKAKALLATQEKKSNYNATHPKKSTPKGASVATLEKAENIKSALSTDPMTTAEINQFLGTEYTPLQVANAMKYAEGVESCKVIRETVSKTGLKAQKEYTAYKLV